MIEQAAIASLLSDLSGPQYILLGVGVLCVAILTLIVSDY